METPRGQPDAILHPSGAQQAFSVTRLPPSSALADLVEYHWHVVWSVEDTYRQQVVPQPRVHLAAEDGRLLVHGISREPFFRTLRGTGHVLGSVFHPGAFRVLLGSEVGALAGTVRPAGDVLGRDDRPAAAAILATTAGDQGDDAVIADRVAAMEAYLLVFDVQADPVVAQVRALVEAAEQDRSLTRADQLAEQAGMSLRSLQRLFTDYVGVGPKWVITRFRILEAAAAAHSGGPVDWAALAIDLGFTDQAHLTRAFTSVVGTPPATYQRQA